MRTHKIHSCMQGSRRTTREGFGKAGSECATRGRATPHARGRRHCPPLPPPPKTHAAPHRGLSGPHDAGHYNSSSWETGFFVSQGGSWGTPYGHFFLGWYSGLLLHHADKILGPATEVLNKHGRPRVFKGLQEVRGAGLGACTRSGGAGVRGACA